MLAGAAGGSPREVIQPTRGWSDEQWDAATAGLVARGILGADGTITDEGRRLHAAVETRTDELAAHALAHRWAISAPPPSRPPSTRGPPPSRPRGSSATPTRWASHPYLRGSGRAVVGSAFSGWVHA